jgi:aminoglycoside 3-N-acetyltransferase I
MRIEPVTDVDTLERGAELFDNRPLPMSSYRFLASSGHHLLFAWDETDHPVGFISGVELIHPDKGTEMYVNEVAVAQAARHRGVATSLVKALAALAREVGCYGMWEVCDPDNDGAVATYRRVGGYQQAPAVVFSWQL